jgi:chromate transporter
MNLLWLFLEFLKIGLFTFGGGYAMIPLVKETVLSHNWLNEEQFYTFLGVCESTPGPIAINMATYVGSVTDGILGSLVASIAVVLPSFIIILIIAAILKNFSKNKYVKAFIKGVKPVITALILGTGIMLFVKAIGYNADNFTFNFELRSVVILTLLGIIYWSVYDLTKKKMPTWAIIVVSIILGIICGPHF